ncbi:peptidase, partial [Turicibacter sanguinis]|nr:peptidase [Turicibacter sanguinis]
MWIFVVLIFIVIILIASNIKVVPQANAYVIERFGAYAATWNVGLHVKIPIMDRV